MKVVCSHCGLPFTVAARPKSPEVFCCSGCALASRVFPAGAEDGAPESGSAGPLVAALTVGFALFNQVLLWLLAGLVARGAGEVSAVGEGLALAEKLVLASLGLGAAAWMAMAAAQWRLGARRLVDGVVGALGAALLALAFWMLSPACAVAATVAQAAWALRGVVRKRAGFRVEARD